MATFLSPAVRLMARLTITRKLLLLAILFLIPLGGSLYAVLSLSVQSIRASQDELSGLAIVDRALDFMRETQVRRGAANAVLAGNAAFRATFDGADAKAAAHLGELVKQAGEATRFDVMPDARKLEQSWQGMHETGLKVTAGALFDMHSALVKQTRLFIGDVADRSSLALDPDSGSYYLVTLMVGQMPKLAELSALARGRGAAIISQGGYADAAQQAELAALGEQIQDGLESVRRDIERVMRGDRKSVV